MSDLAPFVAATLQDQVVRDLQEEVAASNRDNERLRKAISPWTMTIRLPSGTVVARASLSFQDAFAQIVGKYPEEQRVSVQFEMAKGTMESCTLDNFFQSAIALEVATPETSIVVCTKMLAHEGRFEIEWRLFDNCIFASLCLDLPIPEAQWYELDPILLEGFDSTREFAIETALDVVGSQAPIRFREMVDLDAEELFGYLNQHQENDGNG